MFMNLLGKCRSQGLTQISSRLLLTRLHHNSIQVGWEKPAADCVKLNYDGSSKGKSQTAGIGGVFRNSEGEFLLGFAEPIGKATCFMAEVKAAMRGVELALVNGFTNIWLEGDAKSFVEMLNGKKAKSKEVEKDVRYIMLILAQLSNFKVSHVFREGNRSADAFANMGSSLTGPRIWLNNPPEKVGKIVREEAEGKIIRRNI